MTATPELSVPRVSETAPMLVARSNYTDPQVFEQERVDVRRRTWQFVCHTSELPNAGSYRTTTIAGEPVVVWLDEKGELRGFLNACTHRAVEVARGRSGNCGRVATCIYHQWSFDLQGRLVGVPFRPAYGDCLNEAEYALRPVAVATVGPLVFASIAPLVPDFDEYLGEARVYLEGFVENTEVLGRVRWDFPGNWKLWTDNFRDNYHPQLLHRMISATRGGMQPGRNVELRTGHSLMTFPIYGEFNMDRWGQQLSAELGQPVHLPPRPPAPDEETRLAQWKADVRHGNTIFAVFPNFDLQHDAEGANIYIQVANPTAVDHTQVEFVLLGRIGEAVEERRRRLETSVDGQGSWGKISADDLEAAISASRGLQESLHGVSHMGRGVQPGREGHKFDEYSLRSFYKTWNHYMFDDSFTGTIEE